MWRELCHIRRERGARDVLNYCLMILVKPQSDSTMIAQAFEGKNTLARHRFGKNFRPSRSVLKIINTFSPSPSMLILSYLGHLVNELLKDQIAQMHAFSQVWLAFDYSYVHVFNKFHYFL